MLDDRGAEHLEEEVLVRLLFVPAALRLALELRAGADGDEHDAVRIRLHERAPKTSLVNDTPSTSIDREPIVSCSDCARVDPRPAVCGVPRREPTRASSSARPSSTWPRG